MYGLFSLFSISRNVTAARFSSISFQFYSYFMCYSIRNPFLKQMIFRFFLSVTFSNPHFYDRMVFNVKWMLIDFNCDDEWWNNYNYHYIHSIGWLFLSLVFIGFHFNARIVDVSNFRLLLIDLQVQIDLFRQIRQVSKHTHNGVKKHELTFGFLFEIPTEELVC